MSDKESTPFRLPPQRFRSNQDLVHFFRKLNNVVPLRHEKRNDERKYKKEIYCLECYFLTLAAHNLLPFPLDVVHQDRPDFVIRGKAAHGLEISEVTTESYQQNDAHGVLTAYAPERDFVKAVAVRIADKNTKIDAYRAESGFPSCDLLLYENMDTIHPERAFGLLVEYFRAHPLQEFTIISVISGHWLLYDLNGNNAAMLEILTQPQ